MRRMTSVGVIGGLALILALGINAAAQSSISLSAGPGQVATFSGQGTGTQTIGVTLGACSWRGSCTLSGAAEGSGSLASSGMFTITSAVNAIVLTPNGSGGLNANAASPIDFNLSGSANGQTGTLLAGTLDLLQFSQAQGSSSAKLSAGLNLSGGLLASAFASDGATLTFNLNFPCGGNVAGLAGTGQTLIASLSANGAGGISPAPEPNTLALAGVGLLLLGAAVRVRHSPAELTV